MAKDKEEELLNLPEFDEKEFIRSEKNRAKAVVVFFLIGAGVGLLAGYLYDLNLWYFSVLLLFIFILFFRIIMNALGLEMPKTGGQKVFLFMEFFLTFIIFWVLFLNPPISVVSGLEASHVQINHNGDWVPVNLEKGSNNVYVLNSTFTQVPVSIYWNVTVSYPKALSSVSVIVSLYGPSSSTPLRTSTVSAGFHQHMNYVYYVYFNTTARYYPNSGNYLEVTFNALSNGESIHPADFQVILSTAT